MEIGSEADQESAASYVSLEEKIQDLEKKLNHIRTELERKRTEYDSLKKSIATLQSDINRKESGGATAGEIDQIKKDLMEKTQRVSVLRTDIAETEGKIADFEKTAKTTLPASARPPKVAPAPNTVSLSSANVPPPAVPKVPKPGAGAPVTPANTSGASLPLPKPLSAVPKKPPAGTASEFPSAKKPPSVK